MTNSSVGFPQFYQIQQILDRFLPSTIDSQRRSPWEFIVNCLISDNPIPDYFYAHSLEGLVDLKRQIKRQLNDPRVTVIVVELHFDGHSGNHLLVFVPTEKTVFLTGIGTHSDLF